MTKVVCANCNWTGDETATDAVQDLAERIEPGGTVPAGQCPKCGACCYLPVAPARLLIVVEGASITTVASDCPVPLTCVIKDWDALEDHYGRRETVTAYLKTWNENKGFGVEQLTPAKLDETARVDVKLPELPVPYVWRGLGCVYSRQPLAGDTPKPHQAAVVVAQLFEVTAITATDAEAQISKLTAELAKLWPDARTTVQSVTALRRAPAEPEVT